MRTLEDGSTWEVDKRHFTPERPLAKLGGGDVLLAGDRCVVVVSPR